MIDPDTSLGRLVADQPARAETFERLRLDYCCSGGQTLTQACERRGLDPETVCRMLEALEGSSLDGRRLEQNDWRRASIAELCDHIVVAHHDRLRAELPRIEELLVTVVRVHGAQHHELHDLLRLFRSLRRELAVPHASPAAGGASPARAGPSPAHPRREQRAVPPREGPDVTRSAVPAGGEASPALPGFHSQSVQKYEGD
ncbi:MAG TPA: DUF542 domain-containing protein [Solirubrobacteraceae bacterium]|nr:DUF542 domain-containing protein [Solirubrobacteraceae bacterium]